MTAVTCAGTPLMGMGIQPSAYFSPAANRSRPAPLALPSPRQLAGAPLTDGPYARRRTLVDAAPSPMSALRTANAGRTPGPSRASGVKRPAGPEPSWAYRPQGPGEGQGVAAGTPPALLRGSEGEEGQAGAPSSKRPKYASPAAERFDNLVGKVSAPGPADPGHALKGPCCCGSWSHGPTLDGKQQGHGHCAGTDILLGAQRM